MAYINRTIHHYSWRGEIERDQNNHKFSKHKNTSPAEAVLPLVLFILSPRGNPPHRTGVGYYTTMVARTSINLVSFVLRVRRVSS